MSDLVDVFAALGDPNRQQLIELLARRGRASATTLAGSLDVTRQAVDKHLRVLGRAGLVESGRQGREVLYAVRREEFDRSSAWLHDIADAWDRRLADVKRLAENGTENGTAEKGAEND